MIPQMFKHNIIKEAVYSTFFIFITGCSTNYEKEKRTYSPEFAPYSENTPGTEVTMEFTPIPGGVFLMGSPEGELGAGGNEGPQHKVKVDSFWMGVYEISWDQYDLFVNEGISNLSPSNGEVAIEADGLSSPTPPYIDMSFGMGRNGYPAINMTHYAAVMYSKWLTAKTGNFYRLPTEAEWEYACRAGTNTSYNFGNNPRKLDEFAWFSGNSEKSYKKIGKKAPNLWGLYDMHGNVAEWTMDRYLVDYHEKLNDDVADNPWFKPTKVYPRTIRGGSWMDDPKNLKSTSRKGSSKDWKQRDPQMPKSLWWLTNAPFVGFRLVRPKNKPSKNEMEEYWIKAMQDY
jgi:formylglycine-generating enzyme required for sulfatase activity